MASVYTNDLRLEEIGSGEQSGTWGDTTNTNLELIAEAFSFGTEAITTNADTHATTIADGATDAGRSMFLKYTGTLDSACTITIGPNTVSKLWFIENGTSGSQNIIIKQGSGATITIPAGQTKAIYSNGAGSGGAMVDAFATLNVVDLLVDDDLTVTDDAAIGGLATVGGTLAVTGIATFTDDIIIGDGKTIGSASTVGAITIASDGDLALTGVVTANAGVVVDTMTLDAATLTATGAFTVDAGAAINLDSASGIIDLKSAGNAFAKLDDDSGHLAIVVTQSNGDIIFKGNDDGSALTELLKLDTSDGGSAYFNHDIFLNQGGAKIRLGTSSDVVFFADGSDGIIDTAGDIIFDVDGGEIRFKDAGTEIGVISNNSTNLKIQSSVSDKDMQFFGNDGGSPITALTLDMSDVGSATFNGSTRAPFGLFGEIYEVTNGADISLTKVSEDSGIAVSCRSTTNGHTPYLTFQKTPATSGNYTATASGDFLGLINFKGVNTSGGSNEGARIQVVQNGALSGSVPATMIIEASGQAQLHMAANSTSGAAVCIGGTAVSRRLDVRSTNITTAGFFYQDASDVALMQLGHAGATGSNTRTMIQFQNAAGTEKGTIKTTTSATSFNTSSDYRLKENVNYSWDATTRLKQLKPARFNWIEDDTNTLLDGFMAHEVTSVVPEATDGAKDGVKTVTNAVLNSFGNVLAEDVTEADWTAGKIARTDADGNEVAEATYPSNTSWTASQEMPVYQQIDQSKLVPLLVKTILELESRITALEG